MRGVRDHASNLGDWLFMLSTIIRRLIQALVAFLLMVRGADGGGGLSPFTGQCLIHRYWYAETMIGEWALD